MAIRDPNPEFNSMPEIAVDSVDYNLFYKPDRQAVSTDSSSSYAPGCIYGRIGRCCPRI